LELFDEFNADYLKLVEKGTTHKTYTRYLLSRTLLAEFSCFCGLAYVDVKELLESDIVRDDDGKLWIDTRHIKTGAQVIVPLLKVPLAIIQKYTGTGRGGKLFDIPSNQKVNDYLKEIAAICGIDKRVTFHVVRHSKSCRIRIIAVRLAL
jgi:integrase